jgi:serine/threonine-protein kinase
LCLRIINIRRSVLASIASTKPILGMALVTLLAALSGCSQLGAVITPTAPGPGPTQISEIDGMTQVYIPAGEFLMGSAEADVDRAMNECPTCLRDWFKDEMPQHKVYLDAFWIDKTEVTNAMFTQFVEATGYETEAEKAGCGIVLNQFSREWQMVQGADWVHPRGPGTDIVGSGNHPVVQINYFDAEAYCQWAGRRLPTEAEWEKAARGTDGRIYPWGNQAPAENLLNFADRNAYVRIADFDANDGYAFTAPVGSYPEGASPYGVLDMSGNVSERVAGWYSDTYYANSPERNPTGPESGEYVVLRGGSWSRIGRLLRSAARLKYPLINRSSGTGFRCAVSP